MLALQGSHAVPGQLLLLNTTEAFNRLDKAAAIKQVSSPCNALLMQWHVQWAASASSRRWVLVAFLLAAEVQPWKLLAI